MNDNVYGFDFNMNNCYHITDDFSSYISKEFSNPSNASALSDILSNPNSVPVTSSISTSLQPNIAAYSHCNNPNLNLNSSLNSSSSSLSSCSSSPSPSNLSPPSSAHSPSSLSSSSSSCISITSMIDFHKLKNEMTNNIVKPKQENLKSSNPINLSSFSICQSKMEVNPQQSTSPSHPIHSSPINSNNNNNTNNNTNNNNTNNNSNNNNNSNSSHEFTEEEKEGLQISPFLSSVQENYCDITEYLTLPQNQAAKKLQMRPSTFSKRWKEASRNRKWPWRNVRKIDKEITCILHNMPKNGQISEEIESHLTYLLKQRQEELKPVVIRIS